MKSFFSSWKADLPASLVVFLVALPLCLGVALGSTSIEGFSPNLFSGIIAGVIGGVVVGFFSGSRLGVSGPAAGLITIVFGAIVSLGSYEAFLVTVVLAGILQVIAGFLKAGVIGNYFPSSVIKGMLAAIGLTLIFKQIPHLVGYDHDFFGDESFLQSDGENTFSEIIRSFGALSPTAILISVVSLIILVVFDKAFIKKFAIFKLIPGALVVVFFGIMINLFMPGEMKLGGDHLVSIPIASSWDEFLNLFTFPDFSHLSNPKVYTVAFTIALVASLESLLSVEATDKLDPVKFVTPTNRELKAQGVGNILSGLIGGLPITQVIVRSSANINSGGQSKLSTILHGVLLFACVIFLPSVLNLIPYASLAAILLMVGYKLAKISLFKQMYRLGWDQFIPFFTTIVVVLLTDLLKGIFAGLLIALLYIIKQNAKYFFVKNNLKAALQVQSDARDVKMGNKHTIILSREVTFLNKGEVLETLKNIPKGDDVVIDGSKSNFIDYDVLEIIQEFKEYAVEADIRVETVGVQTVSIMGH